MNVFSVLKANKFTYWVLSERFSSGAHGPQRMNARIRPMYLTQIGEMKGIEGAPWNFCVVLVALC